MTDYFSPMKSKEREQEISSLLGEGILGSASMSRLRGVSFLGVLNIAAGVPESLRFSRYDHSVSVAYLTWRYCQNLKLRKEISLMATLAALIHDITHPPFSHSTEVYLRIRSGVETKHTSVLTEKKIVKILKEGGNSFPELLQKEGLERLANRIYRLLNIREERNKYHPYLTDIFDSPFCPDTFDGVNRAWYALNTEEVNRRLSAEKLKFIKFIDPIALIHIISASTSYPFVYKSGSPPSKINPIYKFHDLMRVLYNDVIYSEWQSSAMVMFARALEIAYLDSTRFEISQDDATVIKKIAKNPSSKKIFDLIVKGHSFYSLSKENPSLYNLSLDYYNKAMQQHKPYKDTKRIIESIIAKELKVSENLVFWHKFRPLIWSSSNIQFYEFGKIEDLWRLKWHLSEGEPSRESEIEVYYTTLL